MFAGLPIARHCILVLRDGNIVIDWGAGNYQDVITGETVPVDEAAIDHTILESELAWLKQTGVITGYDEQQAFITGLPELPGKGQQPIN